jgi:hypothetical protein
MPEYGELCAIIRISMCRHSDTVCVFTCTVSSPPLNCVILHSIGFTPQWIDQHVSHNTSMSWAWLFLFIREVSGHSTCYFSCYQKEIHLNNPCHLGSLQSVLLPSLQYCVNTAHNCFRRASYGSYNWSIECLISTISLCMEQYLGCHFYCMLFMFQPGVVYFWCIPKSINATIVIILPPSWNQLNHQKDHCHCCLQFHCGCRSHHLLLLSTYVSLLHGTP